LSTRKSQPENRTPRENFTFLEVVDIRMDRGVKRHGKIRVCGGGDWILMGICGEREKSMVLGRKSDVLTIDS
jgi:hypothetical protein